MNFLPFFMCFLLDTFMIICITEIEDVIRISLNFILNVFNECDKNDKFRVCTFLFNNLIKFNLISIKKKQKKYSYRISFITEIE